MKYCTVPSSKRFQTSTYVFNVIMGLSSLSDLYLSKPPVFLFLTPGDASHCLALVRWLQWSAGCLVTPPKTSTPRLVQGITLPSMPVPHWARAESSACESGRSHTLNWDSSPAKARDASKRRPPTEPCKIKGDGSQTTPGRLKQIFSQTTAK